MKMIDIWHEALRRRGLNRKSIAEYDEAQDRLHPVGGEIMRKEFPERLAPALKEIFEEMADDVCRELRERN